MMKNDETRMTLGKKLKSARKSAALTQEQLAEKLFEVFYIRHSLVSFPFRNCLS